MARGRNANGMGEKPKKVTINGKVYWRARYTDPLTRKQVSLYGKTEAECKSKLMDALTAIHNGLYVTPQKITVKDWLETWLAEYTSSLTDGTIRSYRNAIETHAIPAMGRITLTQLQPQQYQQFVNGLKKKGLSSKTIKNVTGAIHKALQQAVKNGMIARNPADEPDIPRVESKEKHPLEGEQISTFLSAIKGNRFEQLFFVDLYTGMRIGEIIGLRWKDIDFKACEIRIVQQIRPDGSIDEPKHHKKRTIVVAPSVIAVLKQLRREQKVHDPNGLVFCYEDGRSLPHSTVQHNFKRIAKSIGLPDCSIHDLRHTFATECIRKGIDPKTVSVMMGHADAKITLNVYTHATSEMQKAAADLMEAEIINRTQNA